MTRDQRATGRNVPLQLVPRAADRPPPADPRYPPQRNQPHRRQPLPPARAAAAHPVVPFDDTAERAASRGWLIIAVFFGLLGSWALLAPLNGAVVAQAVVKTDGNRKSIQHLEGGIVKELRIKEGDQVAEGDVLIVLDDSQARTELDVLDQLHVGLQLTQARLRLELDGGDELGLPPALAGQANETGVLAAWRDQRGQLLARRREAAGLAELVAHRIAQLESQIGGAEAQSKGLRDQHASLAQELASLQPLLAQGIVTRTRLLQLERSIAAMEGQIGEVNGSISRAQQGIAEQRQLDAQNRNQHSTAVAQELRDVQMRLAEVIPKLANARIVQARMHVRAPYAGRVVGLSVFAVGAVIGRGEKVMDIVPDNEALIVEARIAVEDVADVTPESPAEVRLTAYKAQTTPTLQASVVSVSADRLTDGRTGAPYYAANIRINEGQLDALTNVKLYPGMPATVMVATSSRSALQYLTGPLFASLNLAFREK